MKEWSNYQIQMLRPNTPFWESLADSLEHTEDGLASARRTKEFLEGLEEKITSEEPSKYRIIEVITRIVE